MPEYFLARGNHPSREQGMCAMEWAAYIAGEPHTDQPVCVSPLLKSFCISLNDNWDDEQRQRLRPYLARCIGTASDGLDEHRSWLAMDWLVRELTPAFLELVPSLVPHAEKLRALPPVLAAENLARAMGHLAAARSDAATARAAAGATARDAAWDAARAAAGAAAWDAARAAARDAARAAARATAGATARDAAWDAARAAAWDAAWAAAWDAAWAAAWDAAGDAAWDAAGAAAGDAAGAAAGDALQPVVKHLQASALDLLDRMLPTEIVQLPVIPESEWRPLVEVSA